MSSATRTRLWATLGGRTGALGGSAPKKIDPNNNKNIGSRIRTTSSRFHGTCRRGVQGNRRPLWDQYAIATDQHRTQPPRIARPISRRITAPIIRGSYAFNERDAATTYSSPE